MTKREFWDRYLRAYDVFNAHRSYRAYLDDVASQVCTRPGQSVLDAGSGTGNLSIRMRRLGAEVVSLDSSTVGLSIHREKDPAAALVQASLEAPLPFHDHAFDCVVCTSVLFALSESGRRTALQEFKRVLRPRGRLLATIMRKEQSRFRFACDLLFESIRPRDRDLRADGVFRTLAASGTILYYSLRLRGLRRQEGYRRFSEQEIVDEVRAAGFVQLEHELTFGGHFHMVRAKVPTPPEPSSRTATGTSQERRPSLGEST